jgi:hypothetical protein
MIANTMATAVRQRLTEERARTLPRVVVRMEAAATPNAKLQPTLYLPSPVLDPERRPAPR